jgi:hypothetical protein
MFPAFLPSPLSNFSTAKGEDFRVDNVVFVGDDKEPVSQSTTIFQDGVVYDCMKAPLETVVFDKLSGRFVLLNLKLRTRSELTTAHLAAFIDRLQIVAAKSKDPLMRFLAEPKFEERFNETTGELTFNSPLVTYQLMLSPERDPNIAGQYQEFCDYYARLNTLLAPGSRPPFGRLAVNAALAPRQATASRVTLTIDTGRGGKQKRDTVRSEHRVVRPLEPADLDRVAKTKELMNSLKLVSFEDYRKPMLR